MNAASPSTTIPKARATSANSRTRTVHGPSFGPSPAPNAPAPSSANAKSKRGNPASRIRNELLQNPLREQQNRLHNGEITAKAVGYPPPHGCGNFRHLRRIHWTGRARTVRGLPAFIAEGSTVKIQFAGFIMITSDCRNTTQHQAPPTQWSLREITTPRRSRRRGGIAGCPIGHRRHGRRRLLRRFRCQGRGRRAG